MNKKQMLKEQKRLKKERREVETLFRDDKDVFGVFKIALGVILFILLAFALINIFNGNWNLFSKSNISEENIDSKMVMAGTMFNKSDTEYLVLAYDVTNDNETVYSYLIDNYGDDNLYILDLSSGFNTSIIADKTVISNDLEKLKLSGPTLLVIKGNTITSSYTKEEDIIKYLNKID